MGKVGKRQKKMALRRIVQYTIFLIVFIVLSMFLLLNLIKSEPIVEDNPSSIATNSEDIKSEPTDTSPEFVHNQTRLRKDKCYTFLIVASDQSSGNADTIMVLTFDTVAGKVGIVSIPRDTLINPEDGYSTYPKINSTYLKGIDNLSGAVTNLLGIPIDFFITINTKGFVALIDSIGGIDFDIPVHMSYDDPVQNLYIHFEPGITHLNGEDTLKVCRLRDNNDGTLAYPDYDIGRTRTQQKILITVAKKLLQNPQKINEYIDIFTQYVHTNLSFRNTIWFINPALSLNLEQDISTATLPGDGTVSYKKARYCYELDPEETVKIVNDLISPYITALSIDDMNLFAVE